MATAFPVSSSGRVRVDWRSPAAGPPLIPPRRRPRLTRCRCAPAAMMLNVWIYLLWANDGRGCCGAGPRPAGVGARAPQPAGPEPREASPAKLGAEAGGLSRSRLPGAQADSGPGTGAARARACPLAADPRGPGAGDLPRDRLRGVLAS